MERKLALWIGVPFVGVAWSLIAAVALAPGLINSRLLMLLLLALSVAGILILVIRIAVRGRANSLDALYPTLRRFVEQLQGASTIEVLCRLAAQDIRRMTGFDRVLIYRFDEQWNGTVIAEDRNEVLPSYLDLRFPAGDVNDLLKSLTLQDLGGGTVTAVSLDGPSSLAEASRAIAFA